MINSSFMRQPNIKIRLLECLTIMVLIQTILIPAEAIPGVNLILKIFKLPFLFLLMMGYMGYAGKTITVRSWMVLLAVWVAVTLLLAVMGSDYARGHLIVDGSFFLYGLLMEYYVKDDNSKEFYEKVYWIAVVCFGITWIYSTVFVWKYPTVARAMATGSIKTFLEATGGIDIKGLGGFDFVYGFVIMIPMLMYSMLHEKGWKKWIAIVSFAAGMIYVLFAQYTIAILFSFIAIAISIINVKKKTLLLLILIVGTIILMESGYVLTLIEWMKELFVSSELITDRLLQIETAIRLKSVDKIGRMKLYRWNMDSFLKKPQGNVWIDLAGRMPSNGSLYPSDSEWLYTLSYFGIPLAIVFYMFWLSYTSRIYKLSWNENKKSVLGNTMLLVFALGIVNTLFRSTTIPAIILLIMPCFQLSGKKDEEEMQQPRKTGVGHSGRSVQPVMRS